uniref:D-xylose-proton symporter n=1 Tax=Ganoderma boninense TaxID=34458 RepID=A0A5K1K9B7_9APHY|nr:D-xylose-proton symporter [Ganoderma boninense]
MNISWSSSDHLNADVVDNASGQVLFHINTPYKFFKKEITTMTDPSGQVVAEYEPRLGHDRVTYKGETHRVSDWLPRKGFFSTYVAKSPVEVLGETKLTLVYVWKEKSGVKFKLVDENSDAVVATTHAPNLGIRTPRHNIVIDVDPEIVGFLDLIVISFVICESERVARLRSNQSAASISSASAVAAAAA